MTIYDFKRARGTVFLIFQEVGKTTKKLGTLNEGDFIRDIVGPLGIPFEKEVDQGNSKKVICVGGGVGVAPIFPKARWLKEKNWEVISIIGARTKELLILEEEMKKVSNRLFVCTDDGTYGEHGFVTQVLKRLLDEEKHPDLILSVGPLPMMKASAEIVRPYGIKILVSLNPIMVDGTGMCGSCRVTVGGVVKFACVDGPTFDGLEVDFEELAKRQIRFIEEERIALANFERGECLCRK